MARVFTDMILCKEKTEVADPAHHPPRFLHIFPLAVDIRYLVRELRETCVGLRLANLYDVTPRIYMLKFARPDRKVCASYKIVRFTFRSRDSAFVIPNYHSLI